MITIRVEINEVENIKTMEKLNKTQTQFFEKINKIDKTLAQLIRGKKERKFKLLKLRMKEMTLPLILQKSSFKGNTKGNCMIN